jgi:hypothetical protein
MSKRRSPVVDPFVGSHWRKSLVIRLTRNWVGIVLCALVFLLLGPAIGFVGMLASIAPWSTGSVEGISKLPYLLPVAYLLGGPSALAVGVVYAAIAVVWPASMAATVVRVAVGTVLGAAGALVISGLMLGLSLEAAVAAGIAAGAVCALVVGFEVPHRADGLGVTPRNSLEQTRDS